MQITEDAERRAGERRAAPTPLGERGMRCEECGARWFSAIAGLTVQWAKCASCGGQLHAERRSGCERRAAAGRRRYAAA